MGSRRIRKNVARGRQLDSGGHAAGRPVIPILLLCWQALPENGFQRGMDLARAGQWEQARAALVEAQSVAPLDKRFPLELAGVEYRLGNHAGAQRHLLRALRLDRGTSTAANFWARFITWMATTKPRWFTGIASENRASLVLRSIRRRRCARFCSIGCCFLRRAKH